jgi:hypothetical protein
MKKKNISKKKECFICFNNTKKAIKPLSIYIKKNCKCDNYIHERCLKKWISIRKCCPICNSQINQNNKIENTNNRDLSQSTHIRYYIVTNFYRDNIDGLIMQLFHILLHSAIVFQISYIIIKLFSYLFI